MQRFWDHWDDFPDYILGITKEIWEDRGVGTLKSYYSEDIVLRTPMGIARGNQAIIASTMATIAEFPDRELYGQDVIWSDHPEHGLLSSHRVLTCARHAIDGQFGKATRRNWAIQVIADCAAKDGVIYDEWLVRDYGGLVRQLGQDPRAFAAGLIAQEGLEAAPVFRPENDIDGGYHGCGNDNAWGEAYADHLTRLMRHDFTAIFDTCDRAISGTYAGNELAVGQQAVCQVWLRLRSAFPDAKFRIHHQIGMEGNMLPPRAAIRWSLDGLHEGWGGFGAPTGARVHVMGISHAEFGPRGIRREVSLIDEIAVWKQILGAD